jgi:hypothetical protein
MTDANAAGEQHQDYNNGLMVVRNGVGITRPGALSKWCHASKKPAAQPIERARMVLEIRQ